MAIGRLLHGTPNPSAPGAIGHARGYEVFSTLALAGHRPRMYARLVELSGAVPGRHVLDVGCGTGYLTRMLARAVSPGGSALGVDPSAGMIRYAREHTREDGCTFTEGLAEKLDAPDASFDVVVTSLAVHHFPEDKREQALREMFRVLRPGGRVLVADFRPPSNRVARHLVGAVTGPAMEHNPVHLLEPLTRGAGFENLDAGDIRPLLRYVRATKPTVSA